MQDLPYRDEFHPQKFRLKDPVLTPTGLAISAHLWKIDQKIEFSNIEQDFTNRWQASNYEKGSAEEKAAFNVLVQDALWCILREMRLKGLMGLAESLWHCFIRPPRDSDSYPEPERNQQSLCADALELSGLRGSEEAGGTLGSEPRLRLESVIESEEYPHPLCSPLPDASSGYVWIVRRAIEDGFLWYGRKVQTPSLKKGTIARPRVDHYCVIDGEGPTAVLTPYHELLESSVRPLMADEPICWIVTETAKTSEHGEILHGRDLVRAVWQSKKDVPMRYVLE